MADSEQHPETPEAEEQASSGTGSLIARLTAFAVILVVAIAQCAVAYMFVPDAEETALLARAKQAIQEEDEAEDEAVGNGTAESKTTQEVELKEFNVSSYQPLSNTSLRIDFHLYATVEQDDLEEFSQKHEQSQHRFREQVIVIMRSAKVDDLTEAGLGLIKRRILDKTNRLLGKPYLKSVIFSDFSFVEQ